MLEARRRAKSDAKSSPIPWQFLAKLDLSDVLDVRVERTTVSKGHYTVWGKPDRLLSAVVRVIQVRPVVTETER
jgi:hypothetical protein